MRHAALGLYRFTTRTLPVFTTRCAPAVVTFSPRPTMTNQTSSVVPPTPSTIRSSSQIQEAHSSKHQSFESESIPSFHPSPVVTSFDTTTESPIPEAGDSSGPDVFESDTDDDDDLSPIIQSMIVFIAVTFYSFLY